jgi:polyhydroxybutyrate depolymerase
MKKAGKVFGFILLGLLGVIVLVGLILFISYSWLNRTNGRIETSGETRKYLLYVPESYDPAKATPLIVSLHGFIEWPAHQAQISHWNEVADETGAIVVYPQGSGFPLRWNSSTVSKEGEKPPKDVAFISDLIDKLESEFNIDPQRIYVNGLSNGGGMSYLLACELSDRFAAIGGVAGAYSLPLDECKPERPMPVILFHGTADQIVPYHGSAGASHGFDLPDIPGWVKAWAEKNGCNVDGVDDLPEQGEVSGVRYGGCEGGVEVEFYTIDGGGHTWPGGEGMPVWLTGKTTQDIDATRVMWEFFERFPLPVK